MDYDDYGNFVLGLLTRMNSLSHVKALEVRLWKPPVDLFYHSQSLNFYEGFYVLIWINRNERESVMSRISILFFFLVF